MDFLQRVIACLGATLAIAGCGRHQADSPATPVVTAPVPAEAAPAPAPGAASGSASARIFIDPVTGEVRSPTPAELAAADAATANGRRQPAAAAVKVAPDVVVTPLPGGITEYSIQGGVQVDETACVQKDGRLGECSAAQKAALRGMQSPASKAPAGQ